FPLAEQSLAWRNCDLKTMGLRKCRFETVAETRPANRREPWSYCSVICSAPRSNVNIISKTPLKNQEYGNRSRNGGNLLLSKPNYSVAQPFSAFSRTDEQYFVDEVSMRPVIFVKNTMANKQSLSHRATSP